MLNIQFLNNIDRVLLEKIYSIHNYEQKRYNLSEIGEVYLMRIRSFYCIYSK
jgi:hypothetical protein